MRADVSAARGLIAGIANGSGLLVRADIGGRERAEDEGGSQEGAERELHFDGGDLTGA